MCSIFAHAVFLKFFCPLCFFYFKGTILETSCCKNYICYDCSLDFLRGKGGLDIGLMNIPRTLPPLPCPHCSLVGVQLNYVASDAKTRSYEDSPATKARLKMIEGHMHNFGAPETTVLLKQPPSGVSPRAPEVRHGHARISVLWVRVSSTAMCIFLFFNAVLANHSLVTLPFCDILMPTPNIW